MADWQVGRAIKTLRGLEETSAQWFMVKKDAMPRKALEKMPLAEIKKLMAKDQLWTYRKV